MKAYRKYFSSITVAILTMLLLSCKSEDNNGCTDNSALNLVHQENESNSTFTMVCYPVEELKLWYDTSEFFNHHLQDFSPAKPDTFFSYRSLSHGIASANGEAFPDCLMVLGNRIDFYGSIIDSTNTIVWNGYKPILPFRYYAGQKNIYDVNLKDTIQVSEYVEISE